MYSMRHGLPQMIERAKTQTSHASIYVDGQKTTISSGTYSLLDESGTTIASGAVTIVDKDATFEITSASVPATMLPSDRWQEKWELVIAGSTYTFYRAAYLVLRTLYPCISDVDLLAMHSELGTTRNKESVSYQDKIDAEWESLNIRLISQGKRPQLILDAFAFKDYHKYRVLAAIFRDQSTYGAKQFAELADKYSKMSEQEWANIQFRYDIDEDGNANNTQIAAESVLFLSSVPNCNHYLWVRP